MCVSFWDAGQTKKQHVKYNNEERVVESISAYHVSASHHLLKLVAMLAYDGKSM